MRNHYIMLGMGLLLGAMLALSLAVEAYAAPPPNDVLAAAEKGLPAFLKAIPKSELERYGFNNQQELSEAILGEPHEVFTMTPEAIKSYQGGARLPDLLSKTNLWFFPVIVAGEPRTILTVALMQGKWEAVDIGGLVLPKNLERVGKGLPDMMGTGVKTAYTTRFVRGISTLCRLRSRGVCRGRLSRAHHDETESHGR